MKIFYCIILSIISLHPFSSVALGNEERIDSINSNYDYEFIVSNTNQAIKILTENASLARSIDYKQGLAKANSMLGLANYINGNYDEATSNYLDAIKIYEELGDIENQASLYGEYGYQLKRRDIRKANEYMRLAIKLAEENDLPYLPTAKLYANYGVIKEMENQLDSAMFYYEKTLVMDLEAKDSLGLPYTYNKIAGVKSMQGKYGEAYFYLNKSDEIRANEDGEFGRAENLALHGDILTRQKRFNEAIEKYAACLKLSKTIGYKYLIQYCSINLKDLYQEIGNYKEALRFYEYYKTYTDSLTNLETNARIAELEINYETEKKDRLIAESNLEIEEKSRQFLIAAGIALFLALSSLGIYKYQKQKRDQERKKLELETQLKEAELENRISTEKLRISRELHDNIGSQLTFMISSLDNLTYIEKNDKLIKKLNTLSSFGRDTMKELRNTIWAMKHEDGDIKSLTVKLNELVQNINFTSNNFKISINDNVDKTIKLTSTQMLAVFRIVQESIQNAIKYADATQLLINVLEIDQGFMLQIDDNGTGFDLEKVSKGNGLNNMKSRCEEANGSFSIASSSNGTSIKCIFKAD